jgi:hypothetical protein
LFGLEHCFLPGPRVAVVLGAVAGFDGKLLRGLGR